MAQQVRGDSRKTIAQFAAAHPEVTCDVVLVDGAHTKEVVLSDLRQFHKLARRGGETRLVADDMDNPEVAAAWDIAVAEGLIVEPELVVDNDVADSGRDMGFQCLVGSEGLLGFAWYAPGASMAHPGRSS